MEGKNLYKVRLFNIHNMKKNKMGNMLRKTLQ